MWSLTMNPKEDLARCQMHRSEGIEATEEMIFSPWITWGVLVKRNQITGL